MSQSLKRAPALPCLAPPVLVRCRPPEGQACLYGAEWIWIVAVYPINVFVIVLLCKSVLTHN